MLRAGRVLVDGVPVSKASTKVAEQAAITVAAGEHPDYVGRGALKLAGLLADLSAAGAAPVIAGRRCLDAGASTGGFTEVLLQCGAREVLAVDVGHDQLAAPLRADDRVQDLAGTTVRGLAVEAVGGPVELLVADLSFISLQVVLPDLVALVGTGADLVLLAKPQFEVGRERLGSGGVVRQPELRTSAVTSVARAGLELGLRLHAVRTSRWPGPSGNVEYFLWLSSGGLAPEVDDVDGAVRDAVAQGPT